MLHIPHIILYFSSCHARTIVVAKPHPKRKAIHRFFASTPQRAQSDLEMNFLALAVGELQLDTLSVHLLHKLGDLPSNTLHFAIQLCYHPSRLFVVPLDLSSGRFEGGLTQLIALHNASQQRVLFRLNRINEAGEVRGGRMRELGLNGSEAVGALDERLGGDLHDLRQQVFG